MSVYSTNGAKLFICEEAVTSEPTSETEYQALTWVRINEVESLGSVGDSAEEVSFTAIEDARTRRLKGPRSAGTMELVMGLDANDPGQLVLITAETQPHNYAFKIEFNDAPPSGTPSERYFIANVGSASETLDTASSVTKLNASLWVNSALTRVNASAA